MNAIALAILAGTLAAPPSPFPDGKTIEGFTFSFGERGKFPRGTLTVNADGKVAYEHLVSPTQFVPTDGGLGFRVQRDGTTEKQWQVTKEETAELFRKLVADGLFDVPAPPPLSLTDLGPRYSFEAAAGKWSFHAGADAVPDKVMAHLRPLLAKAHPELWAEKPVPAPRPEPPAKLGELSSVRYIPRLRGQEYVNLSVERNGKVSYQRIKTAGDNETLERTWTMPAKDAEVLLDALVSDGLLDLSDNKTGTGDLIVASAGRWNATFHVNQLPEALSKRLLPLMKKADPEFWK